MDTDLQLMSTLTHKPEVLEDEVLRQKYTESRKYMMKKYNFNEYGRYNGGYPDDMTLFRGNAHGVPGEYHNIVDLRDHEDADEKAELFINREDTVEYGRYMQDDMIDILNKRTYIQGRLDEEYFSLSQFSFFGRVLAFMFIGVCLDGLRAMAGQWWLSKDRQGVKTLVLV